jgi:hypothetical protein
MSQPSQPTQPSQPQPAQSTPAPQKRRPWIRRHPIFSSIIAIPALLCLIFCSLLSSAFVTGFVRGLHIAYASTPQDLAIAASAYGHEISVAGTVNDIIDIKETLSTQSDNATYRNQLEEDCFREQAAFWERYTSMKEVNVLIYAPATYNSTGIATTVYVGGCTMEHVNAVRQPWKEMDYESAWGVYNKAVLEPIVLN